jgi:hypothetical protein
MLLFERVIHLYNFLLTSEKSQNLLPIYRFFSVYRDPYKVCETGCVKKYFHPEPMVLPDRSGRKKNRQVFNRISFKISGDKACDILKFSQHCK